MCDIELFLVVLQVLKFIFHSVGFLRLRYDRAKEHYTLANGSWLKDYLPGIIILVVILQHFYFLLEIQLLYSELSESEELPDVVELRFKLKLVDICHDWIYLILLSYCLARKKLLWQLVRQVQTCHNLLESLAKHHLELQCGKCLFAMGVAQLALLFVLCLKLFFLDWPLPYIYTISDYVLSPVRLLFVLLFSLQFYYHLLHAAVLQSVNRFLKRQSTFRLLPHMLALQARLSSMQHVAASYFGGTFCCFYMLFCIRCGSYMGSFNCKPQDLAASLPQINDTLIELEDPELLAELPQPTSFALLQKETTFFVWQALLIGQLLLAAYVQQLELRKFWRNIWQLEYLAEGKEVENPKDMFNIMLSSRASLLDYRANSLMFVSFKVRYIPHGVRLGGILGGFKLLVQMSLFTGVLEYLRPR